MNRYGPKAFKPADVLRAETTHSTDGWAVNVALLDQTPAGVVYVQVPAADEADAGAILDLIVADATPAAAV